ncbi:uncharacterized protein MONOS_18641 [Monocercomonoides exilis]|uniref:uncharacterized protein n=1 Tax=Monocercomonoides exilis TaxID=2049356 RepID=UPI003559DD6B|nr:hypothetical protein MONOS_18641 [Monocercomonoides exilis]
MIVEEEQKKEEKDDNLLTDLCECYIFLYFHISPEMISICVPCLLKAASNKEVNEEVQKEVEMALLALSSIKDQKAKRELYLNEIKEIIKFHQKHHNLTQLAYQSAWKFLIKEFFIDKSLEEVITNELHFAREAGRELEELTKCVDWKIGKGKEREKETKEELTLIRWLEVDENYFRRCESKNEEYVGLIRSIVKLFRAAKDNYGNIYKKCILSFEKVVHKGFMNVDYLLKGGAIDAVLEEMHRPTLNKKMIGEIFDFLESISEEIKDKNIFERKEEKRKIMKRNLFEKMEEEGYEDILISFHKGFRDFSAFYEVLIYL